MRPEVLVDTSAVLALLDDSDENADNARAWLQRRGNTHGLVIPDVVVSECSALLDRRLNFRATNNFVNDVLPWIEQHSTDEMRMLQALSAYRAGTGRRRPSLADCVSFQLMRDLGIHQAFAFDQHFVDAGFTLVA